jgi:1-aminocyclopropane-1-carboxylate deaminase/D-cysteine desulfhydrase-like pyridoxal-dependent ACC family enzyme
VTDTIGSAAQKASTPIIAGGAAAAGLIGGMVLGRRVLGPRRTVLGIPVSRKGLSLQPVVKEVQKAGLQLGRLTDELAQARKQAKKVGNALS